MGALVSCRISTTHVVGVQSIHTERKHPVGTFNMLSALRAVIGPNCRLTIWIDISVCDPVACFQFRGGFADWLLALSQAACSTVNAARFLPKPPNERICGKATISAGASEDISVPPLCTCYCFRTPCGFSSAARNL